MNTDTNIGTKPSFWWCDGCDRPLRHGEYRFNCTVCVDYDYCETCRATIEPPHPHPMIRELAFGYGEAIEFDRIDTATRIQAAIAIYSDRPSMGVRDLDPASLGNYANSYSWQTFKEVGDRTTDFSHGLRRLIQPRHYLGICAANRPEWVIIDFACILQSIITIPIYCLFNDRDVAFIINNTQISVVVCDKEMLPRFIRLHSECPSLRHLVCMDPISETISSQYVMSVSNSLFVRISRQNRVNSAQEENCLKLSRQVLKAKN